MFQKGLAPLLIILLIALAVGGYLIYSGKINLPQKQRPCTKESRICPDGSTVGRTGPKCEFTPCISSAASPAPNGAGETANWKTYTNKDYGFSLKYPERFTIKEDRYLANQQNSVAIYNLWFYTQDKKYSGYAISIHTTPGKTILQEYPEEVRQQEPSVSVKILENKHGADEVAGTDTGATLYFRIKDTFFQINPIYQDSTASDKIWDYPVINTLRFDTTLKFTR